MHVRHLCSYPIDSFDFTTSLRFPKWWVFPWKERKKSFEFPIHFKQQIVKCLMQFIQSSSSKMERFSRRPARVKSEIKFIWNFHWKMFPLRKVFFDVLGLKKNHKKIIRVQKKNANRKFYSLCFFSHCNENDSGYLIKMSEKFARGRWIALEGNCQWFSDFPPLLVTCDSSEDKVAMSEKVIKLQL